MSIDHFNDWVSFFKVNPPLRELLNLAQANIAYTVAAVAPRGKGRRAPEFKSFTFDFDRAAMSQDEKVVADIKKIFG